MDKELWNSKFEEDFFKKSIMEGFATPEDLFYVFDEKYYAYIKKGQKNDGQNLQSRNSLIGSYTETWCTNLLKPLASSLGLFSLKRVSCPEIGLSKKSPGDVILCSSNSKEQKASDIKLIIEVKMSIVNNYQYFKDGEIKLIGDYKTHKGNPSLLRSDSMLKAIGKSINVRVSGNAASEIPIIIIGNSPITGHYKEKVDYLKKAGIIQGFYSLYPEPCDSDFISETPQKGFKTIRHLKEFECEIKYLLENKFNYFSSMKNKSELGRIIRISSNESSDIDRAEKFLEMIKE